MTDIDYMQLFDLGEKEPDPAVPPVPAGEKKQDPAPPAAIPPATPPTTPPETPPTTPPEDPDEGDDDEGEEQPPAGEKAPPAEKPPMSREERAKNAAERRRAETDAKIKAAVEKARAEEQKRYETRVSKFLETSGLTNPLDGDKPIKSLDDLEKYGADYAAAQMARDLKAGKLTPEMLEQVVAKMPAMQQAQALLAEKQAAEDAEKQRSEQEAIASELREIGKYDPAILTVADLMKLDRAQDFYDRVQRGYSFLDAYRTVYFDRIAAAEGEKRSASARNALLGKDHLRRTDTRGQGAASVPADEMKLYKELNPTATEAEITAHYNRQLQKS